jgi:hypothetical protein
MTRSVISVVVVVALGLPSTGLAQAQGDRMKEVKRACAAGEVDRGVRLLADLYAETNDPTAIYNQARCYQQNARPELAASRFREYLRKAGQLPAAERAEVEAFIREADAEAARGAAAPPAYPAAPPTYPAAPSGYPAAPAPGYPAATPGNYAGPPAATPAATGYPPAYPPGAYPASPVAPMTVAGKTEPVRRKKGLLIAGSITLGVSYLLSAAAGAGLMSDDYQANNADNSCTSRDNCKKVGRLFLIPVLGPWLATPAAGSDLKGGAAFLGLCQAVGLTLTIVGYRSYANSKPKLDGVSSLTGLHDMQLSFAPTAGGGLGLLRAQF